MASRKGKARGVSSGVRLATGVVITSSLTEKQRQSELVDAMQHADDYVAVKDSNFARFLVVALNCYASVMSVSGSKIADALKAFRTDVDAARNGLRTTLSKAGQKEWDSFAAEGKETTWKNLQEANQKKLMSDEVRRVYQRIAVSYVTVSQCNTILTWVAGKPELMADVIQRFLTVTGKGRDAERGATAYAVHKSALGLKMSKGKSTELKAPSKRKPTVVEIVQQAIDRLAKINKLELANALAKFAAKSFEVKVAVPEVKSGK